jgi:rod shape determining protein RodA
MQSKVFERFNFVVLFAALGLLTIGLIAIYSATYGNEQMSQNFSKQLMAASAGIIMVIVIMFLPPKYIAMSSYLFYASIIVMLILVKFFGKKVMGHQSWFSFGGLGIQPSEFAKAATVLMLANFLTNKHQDTDVTRPKDFVIAILIVLFPIGLIMLQPDLGTALVFFALILPVLYWAGMPNFILFILAAPAAAAICAFLNVWLFAGALAAVLIGLVMFKRNLLISTLVFCSVIVSGMSVNMVFNKLSVNQQKRIVNMLNPEGDALGSGYNVIQSKIAIGSGGLWGKGFLQGTQTQLKYIPEQWTDFIFCMVGEEFGFVGSIIVVILFIILIWQIIYVAYICKNRFLSISCIGFATIITFHMLINMGMTMGIMPVIGIPLPFMSYGVSFLISNMLMLGIILNAYRNRKEYV